KDFDEIDRYLVQAKDLFVDLKNQKDLELRFSYLTEEQIKVIQQFWQSFKDKPSKHQEEFLQVWNILGDVYTAFKERLIADGIAYDGLIFREVVENIKKGKHSDAGGSLVFAGFNALTHS